MGLLGLLSVEACVGDEQALRDWAHDHLGANGWFVFSTGHAKADHLGTSVTHSHLLAITDAALLHTPAVTWATLQGHWLEVTPMPPSSLC